MTEGDKSEKDFEWSRKEGIVTKVAFEFRDNTLIAAFNAMEARD